MVLAGTHTPWGFCGVCTLYTVQCTVFPLWWNMSRRLYSCYFLEPERIFQARPVVHLMTFL